MLPDGLVYVVLDLLELYALPADLDLSVSSSDEFDVTVLFVPDEVARTVEASTPARDYAGAALRQPRGILDEGCFGLFGLVQILE